MGLILYFDDVITFINQALQILTKRSALVEALQQENQFSLEIEDEPFELIISMSVGLDDDNELEPVPCYDCPFQLTSGPASGHVYRPLSCKQMQPKVALTRSVTSAIDGDPFISIQTFVDGDPIQLDYRGFDLSFYIEYVQDFIHTEEEMVCYLSAFNASFFCNYWYQQSKGGWLHRLITDSRWNTMRLKVRFGCLEFEDALAYLDSGEMQEHGYEPLLRAFTIRYASTSTSIVSDADIATKLEEWIPRSQFTNHFDQLLDQQIGSYKPRKKTYWDEELKEWRDNDGSLEVKKKIFLSQFSRFPEFEAKRRILQKLIRKAENEVRIKKGFSVVGTLVNESLLYSRLKERFPQCTVVSQYRPKWLGRQSLDIFIQELNVGVEYQGDQHVRPVKFFGGDDGFEQTKLRDQRKLDRCRRNGCKLVYVYPGYNFEDVVRNIIAR